MPAIAQSLAVGIRNNAPTVSDTSMGFEIIRIPITNVSLDPITSKIVFKGTIDDGVAYNIQEVGLWSSIPESNDSQTILTFDDAFEFWDGDVNEFVYSPTVSRVGTSLLDIIVSGVIQKNITNEINETDYSSVLGPDDTWALALNKVGAAAVNVKLLLESASGSLEMSFFPSNTTATGYLFATALVKNSVTVGTFDSTQVTNITVKVIPAAGNAIAGSVQLDGLVATNHPSERDDSILVSRSLITPAFTTSTTGSVDVEYELEVTI